MGYVELIRVTKDDLSRCDSCDQDGLTSSGRSITDSHGVEVIWFCFNCTRKYTN